MVPAQLCDLPRYSHTETLVDYVPLGAEPSELENPHIEREDFSPNEWDYRFSKSIAVTGAITARDTKIFALDGHRRRQHWQGAWVNSTGR